MNSEIIQSFNPSAENLLIADAKVRVKDLINTLDYLTYFRKQETSPEEASTISGIETEIDFYQDQIFNATKEKSRLDILEGQMIAIRETTYQLLGGLFNPKTQGHTLEYHINNLFQTPRGFNEEVDGYPSTHQGDANEAQIELLKQQIELLKQQVSKLEDALVNKSQEKIDEEGPHYIMERDSDYEDAAEEDKCKSECVWKYTTNRNYSSEGKDELFSKKWNVCEICYTRIYDGNELLDENRCDGVYFCDQECLDVSKLKNIYCESCGGNFREDKIIDDRCEVCNKDYHNWLKNYKMTI